MGLTVYTYPLRPLLTDGNNKYNYDKSPWTIGIVIELYAVYDSFVVAEGPAKL